MEDFKSLYRDSLPIKNPEGTWHNGKNMLFRKGWKSPINEDGFDFSYLINGVVIGYISTNSTIVYFIKNNQGVDEIGVVNITDTTPTYTTVIKSNLFDFKLNCPIEGIFIFNSRNDLIIAFSDGIKENSNKPFVINLDTLPLALNADKTLVSDDEFTKLYMFPDKQEATITPSFTSVGNFEHSDVYITYTYITESESVLPYFNSSVYLHLTTLDNGDVTSIVPADFTTSRKGVNLEFTDLDTNFTRLRIGLVFRTATNTLIAYEGSTLTYSGTTLSVSITDLSGFTSASAATIIINPLVIERFNTITKTDSQAFLGNLTLKTPLDFQKYANMLEIVPVLHTDTDNLFPSLHPDEVYAFYIELQYLDGEYSSGYHIPNLTSTAADLLPLTASQISTYNLGWVDNVNYNQFHIFNTGAFNTKCGFWQNTETYPNTDDFDSTTDYDGNSLAGTDLRGTPIKYHRMPELTALYNDTISEYPSSFSARENKKIGIKLTNIDTVIPASIKSQIQGYRISVVKRNNTNNYVLGHWILSRRLRFTGANNIEYESAYGVDLVDGASVTTGGTTTFINAYDKIRAYNPELLTVKPNLTPTYAKVNYITHNIDGTVTLDQGTVAAGIEDEYKYIQYDSNITYRLGDNLDEGTFGSEEAANIDFVSTFDFTNIGRTGSFIQFDSMNFSLKQDLYSGFISSDLVTIGTVKNFNNNVTIKGGDVYQSSLNLELYMSTKNENVVDVGDLVSSAPWKFKHNNIFSTYNDVTLDNFTNVAVLEDTRLTSRRPEDDLELSQRSYTFTLQGLVDISVVNDIITILTFDYTRQFITRFPFRVQKGLIIPNENLTERALRTFLVNSFYEMPNDKGEIIALRGANRRLYIQLRYSLFIATIKDTLNTGSAAADVTFLGYGALFDRPPLELSTDLKGYIGSNSKFACTIIRGFYITVHQDNGQIFIIDKTIEEISLKGNKTWFWDNWKISSKFTRTDLGITYAIDNPYVSVGHLVTYDKEYNRLLFTKKDYEFISEDLITDNTVTFDGEFYTLVSTDSIIDFNNTIYFRDKSRTLSFDLDSKDWLFEHDYQPNIVFYTVSDVFSGVNNLETNTTSIYKHNSKLLKGTFYGVRYESYFELIFNQRLNLTKAYQSLMWVTTYINNDTNGIDIFKTIDKLVIYNDDQCSGVITLANTSIKPRNNEWYFNDFRDLQINKNSPVIDENGDVIETNINNSKIWFDKSNFISKFIIVRLIMSNTTNSDVHIHKLNVKSIINK